MSEQEEKENKDAKAAAKAKVKSKPDKRIKERSASTPKRRRWPLLLTFLIAAASAGGVYYLWQEFQAFSRSVAISAQQTQSDLVRGDEALKQGLSDSDNRVALLEQSMLAMQGKDNMDWLVSEAEYLMRIASHRLQLERDSASALSALKAADSRLFDTQDPYWLPVRNQLARDIAALEAVPAVDSAGLTLRINTLADSIVQMPILKPERSAEVPAAAEKKDQPSPRYWSEIWGDIKQRLSRLVVIRSVERPPGPLLEPEQAAYLQQNLLLKLEGVKLALLRGDENLYRLGLKETREWVETFYDTGSPATREVLRHLTALHEEPIRPALPDISQSLQVLKETRLRRAKAQRKEGK